MNYSTHESLLEVCIVFIVLETLFLFLLFFSHAINRSKTGNSMTSLMAVSYCLCMLKIALVLAMLERGGAGRHIWTLSMPQKRTLLKLLFTFQIVCPMTTSFIKLAVLCFYHRLFGFQSSTIRLVTYAAAAIIIAITIVQLVLPISNCRPIAVNWDMNVRGSCSFENLALWRYLSTPNIATDVMMLAIPAPIVLKIRVSRATKLGLFVTFLVCLFGIVTAVLRFVSFYTVKNFSDISYVVIGPFCWTVIESGVYMIAGIMPALHPLVTAVFQDSRIGAYFSSKFGLINETRDIGKTSRHAKDSFWEG